MVKMNLLFLISYLYGYETMLSLLDHQRIKYEAYQKAQEQKEREEEEARRNEDTKKNEKEREIGLVYQFLDEWDKELGTVTPTLGYIQYLMPRVSLVHAYCKTYDMTSFLAERTTRLVEVLNHYHESRTNGVEEVQAVQDCMKTLFQWCGMEDVTIEAMDTSMDEQLAKHLQETMYDALDVFDAIPVEPPQEYLPLHVPVCSLTKRIGLTLVQLRMLARTHGIATSGSKPELCVRLAQHGHVRLV